MLVCAPLYAKERRRAKLTLGVETGERSFTYAWRQNRLPCLQALLLERGVGGLVFLRFFCRTHALKIVCVVFGACFSEHGRDHAHAIHRDCRADIPFSCVLFFIIVI